jgi:hypothetical protein
VSGTLRTRNSRYPRLDFLTPSTRRGQNELQPMSGYWDRRGCVLSSQVDSATWLGIVVAAHPRRGFPMLRIAVALAISASGLAGWGAYVALLPAPERLRLTVEDGDRDLGEVAMGENRVAIRLTNPASHPSQIMGVPFCCGPTWCVKTEEFGQIIIGPGEEFVFHCDIQIRKAGPFEARLQFYVFDDNLRKVAITVRGVGKSTGGSSSARTQP